MNGDYVTLPLRLLTSVAYYMKHIGSAAECSIDTDIQPRLRVVSLVKYLWRAATTRDSLGITDTCDACLRGDDEARSAKVCLPQIHGR